MKKCIFALTALFSLSVFADDYSCSLFRTSNNREVLVAQLNLSDDGFGERISLPRVDVLDVRIFKEKEDIGVRLASMTGFPYASSHRGVMEQIRSESFYPANTEKMKISLQVPQQQQGANTFTLECVLK